MSLNLHNLVNPIISSIINNQSIKICLPASMQDENYNMITTYSEIDALCQIQLANGQKLTHKDYYQESKIYKYFYIANNLLTGLNRNLGTIGDYLKWNDLYYKVVEVNFNFNSGWVKVTGCESTDFISG
jgi:hypothetical protein